MVESILLYSLPSLNHRFVYARSTLLHEVGTKRMKLPYRQVELPEVMIFVFPELENADATTSSFMGIFWITCIG